MRLNAGFLGLGLALGVVAGCSNAHEAETDAGGILGRDVGSGVDASHETPCGPTTCAVGRVCCNASCGICTLPEEGCIALDCSDAGPPVHLCGGIAGVQCAVGEYCDFPDHTYCGGDDSQGICRPRPTDCPEPGGVTVCGCDGRDYLGECAAYLAGTDVAHLNGCDSPPPPTSSISATQSCGPTDGPAWSFVITDGAPTCGGPLGSAALSIDVWAYLADAGPGSTFAIGNTTASNGNAQYCPSGGGGPPCFVLTGTFTSHAFVVNGTATFSYDLVDYQGTHYRGDHVSVGLWCAGHPLCG